jgi:hypothetical protein
MRTAANGPPAAWPLPQLADHTGEAWVTAFQEQGLEIMGRSGEGHASHPSRALNSLGGRLARALCHTPSLGQAC